MGIRGSGRVVWVAVAAIILVGGMATAVNAGTVPIQVSIFAYSESGNPLNALMPGDIVHYDVGVAVAPTYIPPAQTGGTGNAGLATIVYDLSSAEAAGKGYFLSQMSDAFSGYNYLGNVAVTSSPFTIASTDTSQVTYGGGWGFDRAGLDGGGDTSGPGTIVAAGSLAPLAWDADVQDLAGNQPIARQPVGHGIYMLTDCDPATPGTQACQGGFGLQLGNTFTPGDGTWVVQTGSINTSGWDLQTYNFDLDPTQVALYNGTLNYSMDIAGGFRADVPISGNVFGDSFAFTLIPEPSTVGLLAIAGLALVRRRRS